tara:strand:+ start:190 stop:897 length:708 start_codon:yes stop_codon:yes gene_type:complete
MSFLDIKNLNAFYGSSQVLFNLNIGIKKSKITALLGRNGAGKSSTFKAITGMIKIKSGSIMLDTMDLTNKATNFRAKNGIGYVPEDRQVFPEHTVEENIDLGKKTNRKGKNIWEKEKIWETFPVLSKLKKRLAGQLSGGEQQMLSIARTLVGNPSILLLDEPSEGLAPIIVEDISQILLNLKKIGATILLAEQNMHFCMNIAEEAIIIDRGKNVWKGNINQLKKNKEIMNKYLAV